MNASQRKYAMERVDEIRSVRKGQLERAHKAAAKKCGGRDRAHLIRAGYVGLAEDAEIDGYTRVTSVFDFSAYEGHTQAQKDAHAEALEALDAETASVRDKIMLGDAEEALALLASFSAGTSAD